MINIPISRRRFLDLLGKGLLAAGLGGIGGWQYVTQVEPGWVEVTEVTLPLARLARSFNNLRMVQLSDIHLGNYMGRRELDRVVRLVLSLHPDVVAITGDFVTGHGWRPLHDELVEDLVAGLKPLADATLVVAVLGNHDHWTRASKIRAMLARAGVVELSNTVHTLHNGADQFHLAGVDDIYVRAHRLDRVLERLPAEGAAVLLAHEPDFADKSAATGRFDLQISGHSHGGQVALPFYGPIVLPKYAVKYPSGLYRVGSMYQYTNRGVGTSRLAVRFNCRPEVTAFTLKTG